VKRSSVESSNLDLNTGGNVAVFPFPDAERTMEKSQISFKAIFRGEARV
jgi:hypothetical protein